MQEFHTEATEQNPLSFSELATDTLGEFGDVTDENVMLDVGEFDGDLVVQLYEGLEKPESDFIAEMQADGLTLFINTDRGTDGGMLPYGVPLTAIHAITRRFFPGEHQESLLVFASATEGGLYIHCE